MGGSSGSSKNQSVPESEKTAYANAPVTMTFQPHLPGMENSIATQLARGFGGDQGGIAEMLAGMYQPMTIQRFMEPISTTAAMFDKSKQKSFNTGNAALDRLLMGETIGEKK